MPIKYIITGRNVRNLSTCQKLKSSLKKGNRFLRKRIILYFFG